jgi:hypothetical protein
MRPDRPTSIEKAQRRRPGLVEKGQRGRRLGREETERHGRHPLDRRAAERLRLMTHDFRIVRDEDDALPWTGT